MIRARVDAMFAAEESQARCPGEERCDKFQRADPESEVDGEVIGRAVACIMCELRATKPAEGDQTLDAVINQVERLTAERQAGFPVDLTRMTHLEAEGLIFYTQYHALKEKSFYASLPKMY